MLLLVIQKAKQSHVIFIAVALEPSNHGGGGSGGSTTNWRKRQWETARAETARTARTGISIRMAPPTGTVCPSFFLRVASRVSITHNQRPLQSITGWKLRRGGGSSCDTQLIDLSRVTVEAAAADWQLITKWRTLVCLIAPIGSGPSQQSTATVSLGDQSQTLTFSHTQKYASKK